MVLMKAVLHNVTACIAMPQPRGPDGQVNNGRTNQGGLPLFRSQDGSTGTNGSGTQDAPEMSLEDLDLARSREIEGKALTGVILLLLKWFKISREFYESSTEVFCSLTLTCIDRCSQV